MKTTVLFLTIFALSSSCSDSNFASSGGGKSAAKKTPKAEPEETSTEEPKKKVVDKDESDTDVNTNVEDEVEEDTDSQVACKNTQDGYVGNVYRLPENQPSLPDFSTLTAIGQVESTTLDVAPRDFTAGFPGVADLNEWFGIQFIASLDVPADGAYKFRTNSDDGSKLFIDGVVNVSNDGLHGPAAINGAPLTLTKGKHELRIDWFQGPKQTIALQVYWAKPGETEYQIIPAEVLKHKRNCDLNDLGTF